MALFCLAVLVWSVAPSFSHTPTVLETIHDHLEMIADHGHSHGFEDDLYWAMHGHSHDTADHDHSQAFRLSARAEDAAAMYRINWANRIARSGPDRIFRIERPPRA